MRNAALIILLALGGAVALADAGSHALWDIDDARVARKIEIQVDKAGALREVEFHVDPDLVPAAVHAAMEKLHPGGTITGAEIERQGGELYYELTSTRDGRAHEAMFEADGTLHSEENEVEASAVPEAVRQAVAEAFAGGTGISWEEIRDAERELEAYHAKLTQAGRRIKVALTTGGTITHAVLEVEAEIEVPLPLR